MRRPRLSRDDVEIEERTTPFRGFMRVDRYRLRHRTHEGSWTPTIALECLHRGYTVSVLPYDPWADAVVLVEQFRLGAYAAGLDPWVTEAVAGTIDGDEDPEATARREVVEEIGRPVDRLESIGRFLLVSGASTETTAMYCGRVDSEGAGGVHGLADEAEDILVRVLPAAEAIERVADPRFATGYTAIPLQWLALNRARLLEEWA